MRCLDGLKKFSCGQVHNLHSEFWVGTHAHAALALADSLLADHLLERARDSAAVHTRLNWQLEVGGEECAQTAAEVLGRP